MHDQNSLSFLGSIGFLIIIMSPIFNISSVAGFSENDRFRILTEWNDIDQDGILDSWELLHGLNITNPEDANQDFDGDGLRNVEEYLNNTDPNDSDTDNDTFSDSEEILNNSNPLDKNSIPQLQNQTDFSIYMYIIIILGVVSILAIIWRKN